MNSRLGGLLSAREPTEIRHKPRIGIAMLKALLTDLLRLKVLAIALALFAVACAGEPTPTYVSTPTPAATALLQPI